MLRSFIKNAKEHKRTQRTSRSFIKNARTLRSFETNDCPTLIFTQYQIAVVVGSYHIHCIFTHYQIAVAWLLAYSLHIYTLLDSGSQAPSISAAYLHIIRQWQLGSQHIHCIFTLIVSGSQAPTIFAAHLHIIRQRLWQAHTIFAAYLH